MEENTMNQQVSKPRPTLLYRWMVLLVISVAMFGNYYVYDSIAPIADMLKSNLGFTDENIGIEGAEPVQFRQHCRSDNSIDRRNCNR